MTVEEMIHELEETHGYVVMTDEQWSQVCDALGPASDDVLDLIFGEDDR